MKKSRAKPKPRIEGVERAYRAASIFLRETGEFRLSIATFGHPDRVDHWLARLQEELQPEGVHLTRCRIPEIGNPRLLEQIVNHIREVPTLPGHARSLVVTGISRHLPDAAAEHHPRDPAPPFLAQANLDRELFPASCPHPLLLCVTPTAYRQFRRHAPDLVHWVSHTFDFSESALPDGSQPIRGIAELQQSGPGTIYANREELHTAAGIFRTGLDAAIAAYGPTHRETVGVRANLANVLDQLGRTREAVDLARENLQIIETIPAFPETEISRHKGQLAYVLEKLGAYGEAEPLVRDALRIDLATYGDDHPRVATRLNNLCQLLQATNRLSEAEPLMREVLRINRAAYGDDHPRVASNLNNLALLHQDTNRLAKAEPLIREALRIDRAAYRDDHPDVARDLGNLAHLLKATNRLAEAEPLMRDALRIGRAAYGDDHPSVALRLNNLATLLQDTNRLSEAEPLMREALRIDRAAYGDVHPDVARDLNNLATLLQDTNRLSEAEPLMRDALRILHDSLGPEHPNTVTASRNLDGLLEAMKDLPPGAEGE